MKTKFLFLFGMVSLLSNPALASFDDIIDDVGLTPSSQLFDENQIDEEFFFENSVDDVVYNGTNVKASDVIAKATYPLVKIVNGIAELSAPACSATLIGKDLLLTAAHCFRDKEQRAVRVYWPSTKSYKNLRIVQVRSHEKFREREDATVGTVVQHDIALVRIEQSIPGGIPALIPAISLEVLGGQSVIVAGYGQNGRPDPSLPEMMQDPVVQALVKKMKSNPTMNQAEKDKVFSELLSIAIAKPLLMGEASIRLVSNDANPYGPRLQRYQGRSTCPGDSGGPSYLRTQSGRLVVIGVHSIGNNRECQAERTTGVFIFKRNIPYTGHDTFVPDYTNWIRSTAKRMKAQVGI